MVEFTHMRDLQQWLAGLHHSEFGMELCVRFCGMHVRLEFRGHNTMDINAYLAWLPKAVRPRRRDDKVPHYVPCDPRDYLYKALWNTDWRR